jgi:hypothetical protein
MYALLQMQFALLLFLFLVFVFCVCGLMGEIAHTLEQQNDQKRDGRDNNNNNNNNAATLKATEEEEGDGVAVNSVGGDEGGREKGCRTRQDKQIVKKANDNKERKKIREGTAREREMTSVKTCR